MPSGLNASRSQLSLFVSLALHFFLSSIFTPWSSCPLLVQIKSSCIIDLLGLYNDTGGPSVFSQKATLTQKQTHDMIRQLCIYLSISSYFFIKVTMRQMHKLQKTAYTVSLRGPYMDPLDCKTVLFFSLSVFCSTAVLKQ